MRLGYKTLRPAHKVPLSPVRLHFLKAPPLSKRVPPARNEVFKHMSLKETFHTQTLTGFGVHSDSAHFFPKLKILIYIKISYEIKKYKKSTNKFSN